jgi:hypothetical protein
MILIIHYQKTTDFHSLNVLKIQPLEIKLLPVFVLYVALAICVKGMPEAILVFGVLTVLTYQMGSFYFNPQLSLLGYRFYEVTTDEKAVITLITKEKSLKMISELKNLVELDEFTYLQI